MGKGFHKNLQIYLSKLRKAILVEPRQHSMSAKVTVSWLLSACKYPRTPSFTAGGRHRTPGHDGGGGGAPAATLSDVDRFLFENFTSLYTGCDGDNDADGAAAKGHVVGGPSPPPRNAAQLPPEVRGARRFFGSPGTSISAPVEARRSEASTTSSSSSPSSSSTAAATQSDDGDVAAAVPDNSVAVMTFSKDPYEDFRRSMEEMVDARHVDPGEPLDWDFMEELLISFLDLNDRRVHEYILCAFTDLAVTFRRQKPPSRRRRQNGGGGRG